MHRHFATCGAHFDEQSVAHGHFLIELELAPRGLRGEPVQCSHHRVSILEAAAHRGCRIEHKRP